MRTVKWNPFLSAVSLSLGALLLWGTARADVTVTNPAAILIFPRISVVFPPIQGVITDTVIQISNTSVQPANVRCFYVNANGHCSNDFFTPCLPNQPPNTALNPCVLPNQCIPGWVETDFAFRLTPLQPVRWSVGQGLLQIPTNPGGSIPPAPELPLLVAELKCVQVEDDGSPSERNDLKGEATIEYANQNTLTTNTAGYNAIGIQAIPGTNNGDDTLVLGEEYNGCPNLLVLDHFFDGAVFPQNPTPPNIPPAPNFVGTLVSWVPCSEDFNLQNPQRVTVQCLVFNEFEQRFSTSRPIQCVESMALSDIDTRPGPADDTTSIFHVNVEGTLTGQTICRGVDDPSHPFGGQGILAMLEEFHSTGVPINPLVHTVYSAAFHPHHRGIRERPDVVDMPPGAPPPDPDPF